ncbi:type II toxin-antitoxin system Phd/YefM family antitoxin [bacterium]|nr:MAG: type II toxin-antitoxin system Phd/YefM family antitoxin [bacterium]
MRTINLYDAKTHLSALVSEALQGAEVVLARSGKPLVRLVPVEERKPGDAFGMDRGLVKIAPDFDQTPADFVDYT